MVGIAGEGDEMKSSLYSAVELCQRRLPLHLVEDVFSYFSFQDLDRMRRYSNNTLSVITVLNCAVTVVLSILEIIRTSMFQRVTGLEVTAVESGHLQPRHPVSPAWLGRPME